MESGLSSAHPWGISVFDQAGRKSWSDSGKGGQRRRRAGTHMYRSSDSLLTRISLILSILKSSPSMSSMVVVESAMETISSSANETGPELASRRCQIGAEDNRDHRAVMGTPLQTPEQHNH